MKKSVSKTLLGWADVFVILAVIFLVVSFAGWIMNSAWVDTLFLTAVTFIFLTPLTRGMAILVKNAEEQIADRRMIGHD